MAPNRTPGGFGSKLREARERRGITLREIANATKISISVLEALERNDVSRLPGGIFGRAFVRSYAIEVGLNPEETIQEFVAQLPQDSLNPSPQKSAQVEDNESIEADRRMASAFLRLVAISVPAAAAVLYFGFAERQAAPAPSLSIAMTARAEPGTTSRLSTPSPAVPAASGAEIPPVPVPAAAVQPALAGELAVNRLTVALVATGDCWVSATVDGRRLVDRELRAGERQQFDVRREIELTAADAGRLTLTFNGAEVRPLGASGQIVTARVNLTNFKDYLAGPR